MSQIQQACTNQDCEIFGHKVLPQDAKFCPKCGTRIKGVETSDSCNTRFVPHDNDIFTVGNSTFCKIYAACPACLLEDRAAAKTHWIHADNNCGGYIYMGTDGSFICGKCGLERLSFFWNPLCRIHNNADYNSMVTKETPDRRYARTFAYQMMPYLGCANTFHLLDVIRLKESSI